MMGKKANIHCVLDQNTICNQEKTTLVKYDNIQNLRRHIVSYQNNDIISICYPALIHMKCTLSLFAPTFDSHLL